MKMKVIERTMCLSLLIGTRKALDRGHPQPGETIPSNEIKGGDIMESLLLNQKGLEDLQQQFPYHSQGEGMYYRSQGTIRHDSEEQSDPSSCYPANCDYESCSGVC